MSLHLPRLDETTSMMLRTDLIGFALALAFLSAVMFIAAVLFLR